MKVLLLLSVLVGCAISLPENYHHLPTYKIDLDLPPAERFVQVTSDLKDQTNAMIREYLWITPFFVREFFKNNLEVIKEHHLEHYQEVESAMAILEQPIHLGFLLNFAFEIGKALCTSVVARQTDGTILHGRNMDFAFPDTMRNATYIGQFYRNGEYLYSAVMFGGYSGVVTAFKENAWSFSMNGRHMDFSVANYMAIMGEIKTDLKEVGFAIREALEKAEDFEDAVELISEMETIVPLYGILAGVGWDEGAVVTKDPSGVANLRQLDRDTWYLLQTNDDHWDGDCLQRCKDGNAHMEALGQKSLSMDTLLEDVILQGHTFNYFTVYTTMAAPVNSDFRAYGLDTDIVYLRDEAPEDLSFFYEELQGIEDIEQLLQ